ncbi:tRNA 2-selenouridine(34) synthase MnmH [Deltaproteobacteria bacterium TL4]
MKHSFKNKLFNGSCNNVSVAQTLRQSTLLVDVRTSREYADGSIPGSINIPLFSNEERAEIGTLYKQVSKETAVDTGFDIVHSRLSQFVEQFAPYKSQFVTIYCARGGMRSFAVVRLLGSLGFDNVQQLEGGYKYYRQYTLSQMDQISPKLIVLHGQTGVGKTCLLTQLSHSIDLEDLAQHRSSLFGAINRIPRTQKNFEGFLLKELLQHQGTPYIPLFIEGESRKIGNVFMPKQLAQNMQQSMMVLLKASLETRIERILADYLINSQETYQQTYQILQSLRTTLSSKTVNRLCQCLEQNNLEEIVHTLLVDYYDPRYQHSMKHYRYVLTLSVENLNHAKEQLISFRNSLHASC